MFEETLSTLATLGIKVDSLSQTTDNKWEARLGLRYHTDGRHIQVLCLGRTPVEALTNALDQIEWHKANPPAATPTFQGSLEELLGLVAKSNPREMTKEEAQSLML